MSKILFILPSLNKGGAEKITMSIFEKLPHFEKKLIVFDDNCNVNNSITYNNIRLRSNVLKLIKSLIKEKPDIVFSSHFHINAFLIIAIKFLRLKTKIVVRQSSNLSRSDTKTTKAKVFARLYKYADLVVFQTNYMKEDFEKNTFLSNNKKLNNSKVIYNPIEISDVPESITSIENFYLSVGSLKKVKNFSYLIHKYHEYLQYDKELLPLYIIGDGPDKAELEELITYYNLANRIKLLGKMNDVSQYYSKAKGVIICSLNEGLPNVLLEAISHRCNVMVRKHNGGTKEVLEKVGLEKNFIEEIDFDFTRIESTKYKHIKALEENFGQDNVMAIYSKEFRSLIDI